MGKLYESYKKICLEDNLDSNAQLIYNLVAEATNYEFKYSIKKGSQYNQFWLYSTNPTGVLLQASQCPDGEVKLSIQGMVNVKSDVKNFLNYYSSEEREEFMKYLELF